MKFILCALFATGFTLLACVCLSGLFFGPRVHGTVVAIFGTPVFYLLGHLFWRGAFGQ